MIYIHQSGDDTRFVVTGETLILKKRFSKYLYILDITNLMLMLAMSQVEIEAMLLNTSQYKLSLTQMLENAGYKEG